MRENVSVWIAALTLFLAYSTGLVYGSVRIVLWLAKRLADIESAVNTRVSTDHFKEEIDIIRTRVTTIEKWALLDGAVKFSSVSMPDYRSLGSNGG